MKLRMLCLVLCICLAGAALAGCSDNSVILTIFPPNAWRPQLTPTEIPVPSSVTTPSSVPMPTPTLLPIPPAVEWGCSTHGGAGRCV